MGMVRLHARKAASNIQATAVMDIQQALQQCKHGMLLFTGSLAVPCCFWKSP
jgi:hypothetical protein